VREIAPKVWAASGYSGQGVALAPLVGKLMAAAALGRPEPLSALTGLPIPPFPTPSWIRTPLVSLEILRGRITDRF
jgi:gamma-glutamylputrescine oxidase